MRIKSVTDLSDFEIKIIREIRDEAKCVNEALKLRFGDGFHRYDEETDTAYFGAHGPYITREV